MSKITKRPEVFFLILSLIIGTLMVFIIPIGIGYDEGQHFARIWEMALFKFIPNEWLSQANNGVPAIFSQMSYRRNPLIEPLPDDFWETYKDAHINTSITVPSTTRAVYPPPMYIVQALIIRYLGLKLDFPAIWVYYLCRLSYLWIYCLLAFLAIQILPFGKWLMTVLALAPMALIQATTLNPDAIQNGGCFLFIAWILHLIFSTNSKPLNRNELIITFLMILLLFSLKTSAFPLILMLPLIPAKKFKNLQQKAILISIFIAIFLILGVGWNIIATSQIQYGAMPVGSNFLDQTRYILADPLKFLITLISDPVIHAGKYLTQWMGVFPTGYWEMPALVYFLFPISLFLAWLMDRSKETISSCIRFDLTIIFLLSFFATILIIYISFTPVGTATVPNIYGRYFLGITPLLFLALTRTAPEGGKSKQKMRIVMVSTATTLVIALLGMFLSYHVPCGMWYYTPGKCYMPQYKNWNPDNHQSIAVQEGSSIDQTIESGCKNMDGIRLWTFRKSNESSSSMLIEVKEYPTNKIIAAQKIPSDQIKNNNWLEVYFPRITGSFRQRYVLHVSTTSPKDSIYLALSEPYEYRFDLLVNNVSMDRDLLFQQRCALGLDSLFKLDENK